jgi:hypothetical protein
LPVPLLPTAIMFSRRVAYSERASSRTRVLFSEGIAAKSKLSRPPAPRRTGADRSRATHGRASDQGSAVPGGQERSRRHRTAASPNVAYPLADSARKVRQTPIDGQIQKIIHILIPRWHLTRGSIGNISSAFSTLSTPPSPAAWAFPNRRCGLPMKCSSFLQKSSPLSQGKSNTLGSRRRANQTFARAARWSAPRHQAA